MKLGDVVLFGSYNEVLENMRSIHNLMSSVMRRIKTELKRDSRRVILENLLQSSINNVDSLIHLEPSQNTMFAWATRNLYELNLITRFVLESEDHLNQWIAQMAQDEIEIWEGALTLADKEKHAHEIDSIRERIDSIRKTAEKHSLELTKIPITRQLAEHLGLSDEHSGFYKIYSKFVHPSSILVNKPDNINLKVILSILQINAQKYALDTLNRISEATGTTITENSS